MKPSARVRLETCNLKPSALAPSTPQPFQQPQALNSSCAALNQSTNQQSSALSTNQLINSSYAALNQSTNQPMNKVIYKPSGKAREYSQWAANFYYGCSNDCTYCYCKRGPLSRLWSTSPTLKKSLRDHAHAMEVFRKELDRNLEELRQSYLLFSFTTDPLLPSTRELTIEATLYALSQGVQVSILTKCADMQPLIERIPETQRRDVAIGFTLTGADDLEPNAATNKERMQAMRQMFILGFRTYASIEPVIEPSDSMAVITKISDFCELFKVGVLSGTKKYTPSDIREMVNKMAQMPDCRFYLKDSLIKFAGISREELDGVMFVTTEYVLLKTLTDEERIACKPDLLRYYNILFTNDIACSMVLEVTSAILKDPSIYRHMVKKKLKEIEEFRKSYEEHIKLNYRDLRKDYYFLDDVAQYLMDYISEDVKNLTQAFLKLFDGNIKHPGLFVKIEIARVFVGFARKIFDARNKELGDMGYMGMKEFYRMSKLLPIIEALYHILLQQFRFKELIRLDTPENIELINFLARKLTDLKTLPKLVHDSELNNLTKIE